MTTSTVFSQGPLGDLHRELTRIGRLRQALALLGWDQETLMPPGGAAARAGTIGDLTEIVHRRAIAPELADRLSAAEAEAQAVGSAVAVAYCREARRDHERRCNVPPELAQAIARTASEAQQVWRAARAASDFARFQPCLEQLLALKREEAQAVDARRAPYDTMLDDYEPGMTGPRMQALVTAVKPTLVELVARYAPRMGGVRADFMAGPFPVGAQQQIAREIIAGMGFDLQRGRLDVSTHPFCSGLATGDVRLTSRYHESNLDSIFSVIHEAGHGLYEQGLDPAWELTPYGGAVSLGIHESQSRLWENLVGRSAPFWTHFFPRLQALFPAELGGVTREEFLRAINRVQPSLIRVEADEVTYSLHVMLRFEIEQRLVAGELAVADLPAAWREQMRALLGLEPPSDREGVLQDIHWSFGAFGYFPTYFLGNLYSAQIYEAAGRALPDLDGDLARGLLAPLREWLGAQVHRHGSHYAPLELCRRVTGQELDPACYLTYLQHKLTGLYG